MTIQLTDAGLNLIQRALAESVSINFDHLEIGNGDDQWEEGTDIDALGNSLKTIGITSITIEDGFVRLSGSFNNNDVLAAFRATELGVFATDPDDPSGTIMYAYGYDELTSADYIPVSTDRIVETVETVLVYVGNAENVTATIAQSLVYATKEEFEDHINDHNNPHHVTKAQVGLGNVPNVTTNNQTPTFIAAGSPSALASGGTMSTQFGKLAAAVNALINHIANRSNPHAVTYSQAGAAAAEHTHSAADINSGTLAVARGGTGVTSLQALFNALKSYIATGMADTFAALSHNHSASNITSGTLPVSRGGTGRTTISAFADDLKTYLAALVHTHSASDIVSGTLPVERGGSGVTTLQALFDELKTYIATGMADTFAALSHNHSATNITSGTLPVSRGGTGRTTVSAFANDLKTYLAALVHTHSASDIASGTLPVERGGTGETSVSDFADDLKAYLAARDHSHTVSEITDFPDYSFLPDAMGWYTGDGTTGSGAYKTVSLGFTPSRVMIIPVLNAYTVGSAYGPFTFAPNENLYHNACGTYYYTCSATELFERNHGGAAVVTGGFGVQYYSSGHRINDSGSLYYYLAWK